MRLNDIKYPPESGKIVQVFIRLMTGQLVHRDGKWDGHQWLVRDLYSKRFSHWPGVELLGWLERT